MKKKVHFHPLVRVRPIPYEDRRGTWAIDGTRFRDRIHYVGAILEPVLIKKQLSIVMKED